ncbi:CYFA0S07e00892g1_1 [Cyberlindnera fabianii]|uniref:CYFA0S07e00892g1_1 n=1 Tax=Cyberlindnera fabianii TaxID=36022 RepID=A0A061B2V2_CYBFA|nr:CYFA0S07e00892g1_1 [Cyberlindnera fabianii]
MTVPTTILIGTVVGVLSSATQSVGLTLQRKSHMLEELRPSNAPYRAPYHRPLWRWGFFLFLLANLLGSSIQITTLPLIILSPLQAVGLVFNSVCAAIILEEGFTSHSIAGTVLVGFGALLIAGFGSIEEPNHSLKELLELIERPPFVAWISASVTGVLCILAWVAVVKVLHTKMFSASLDHIPCAVRHLFDIPVKNFRFARGILYGIISGMLSAHSLLLAKSAVELLLNALVKKNWEAFSNIKTWIIVGSFFVLAITQLIFLNKGLSFVSTSVLYPLVFCVYNITNIVNGLVFYNQIGILSGLQITMIILGTLLVLLGVFSLSWRLEEPHDEESHQYKTAFDIHDRGQVTGEHTSLLGPDEEETMEYVSFGSPVPEPEDYEPNSTASSKKSQSSVSAMSPVVNFKDYGSLSSEPNATIGPPRNKHKRRSKRMLSYEQNELLAQINQMPDFP